VAHCWRKEGEQVEVGLILAVVNVFFFALSGLLLLGAIGKYNQASKVLDDTRKLALKLYLRGKR
jgi:hypothetical protein